MSQLNIDNIANQLGTGGPDFVGMPSVGGDPIVESGSNSDGGWTRWADGTQQCRAHVYVDWSTSTRKEFFFPIAFTDEPGASIAGVSGTSTSYWKALGNSAVQVDTSKWLVVINDVTTFNLLTFLFATGRWK